MRVTVLVGCLFVNATCLNPKLARDLHGTQRNGFLFSSVFVANLFLVVTCEPQQDEERPPLVMQDLISYDEMAISALISVSVQTPFFNRGERNNRGIFDLSPLYPFFGIYTGPALFLLARMCCFLSLLFCSSVFPSSPLVL